MGSKLHPARSLSEPFQSQCLGAQIQAQVICKNSSNSTMKPETSTPACQLEAAEVETEHHRLIDSRSGRKIRSSVHSFSVRNPKLIERGSHGSNGTRTVIQASWLPPNPERPASQENLSINPTHSCRRNKTKQSECFPECFSPNDPYFPHMFMLIHGIAKKTSGR